ncbi:MAG: hypothetical protein AB9888_15200, partial [Bacteroidales bacterium]
FFVRRFTHAVDPGTYEKTGVYSRKPIPYGFIVIGMPREIPYAERIHYLVKLVQPLLPVLIQAGATEWYVDIARYYSTQCNESLSNEQLALLASLNCPLHYSAYCVSEEEEEQYEIEFGGFDPD